MSDTSKSNDAVWRDAEKVAAWAARSGERERARVLARQMMADLLPFEPQAEFSFVDLGAGTGAASRVILDRFPAASAVLADYSSEMMSEGARQLEGYEGRYRYVAIDLEAGRWPAELSGGLDAVVSSLCVHHLSDGRKQGLFSEVIERLRPGAWYLNYDPVKAEDPSVEEAWQAAHDRRDPAAAEKRADRSPEEQAHYENHIRHIIPLAPQLAFLRSAGFEAVDVYWKELDHVIMGGRRPFSGQ